MKIPCKFDLRFVLIVLSVSGVLSAWIAYRMQGLSRESLLLERLRAQGCLFDIPSRSISAIDRGLRSVGNMHNPEYEQKVLVHIVEKNETVLNSMNQLPSVSQLEVVGIDLGNFSALSQCIHVSKMELRECELTSLWGIEKLQSLADLSLGNCIGLTSLDGLEQAKNLKRLFLNSEGFMDLDHANQIKQLTRLEQLEFESMPLESLQFVSGLRGLQSLSVGNAFHLRRLDGIESLSNLKSLSISEAKEVEEVGLLSRCRQLRELRLGFRYPDEDLRALSSLTNLRILEVSGSAIASLKGLEHLQSLVQLRIVAPHLTTLEELEGSRNTLQMLQLWSCKSLESLENLGGLEKLRFLSLQGGHKVTDLSSLRLLKRLEELDLMDCPGLTDISSLKGIESLRKIYIKTTNEAIKTQLDDLSLVKPELEIVTNPKTIIRWKVD